MRKCLVCQNDIGLRCCAAPAKIHSQYKICGRINNERHKPSTVRTRARWGILALISIGTMINYLDRTVLGIAAPSLRTDLAIDAATMGVVFSAFSWTYAIMQIPGGVFLDRFGTKLTYSSR